MSEFQDHFIPLHLKQYHGPFPGLGGSAVRMAVYMAQQGVICHIEKKMPGFCILYIHHMMDLLFWVVVVKLTLMLQHKIC